MAEILLKIENLAGVPERQDHDFFLLSGGEKDTNFSLRGWWCGFFLNGLSAGGGDQGEGGLTPFYTSDQISPLFQTTCLGNQLKVYFRVTTLVRKAQLLIYFSHIF